MLYNNGLSLQARSVEEEAQLTSYGRVECGGSVAVEGDTLMFKGGSSVGVVKFLEPMNPLLNYFEYVITDRGVKTTIGIGVGESRYPLTQQPGWSVNSIGYHADDGSLFCGSGFGQVFGPTCSTGDRMGCGVDFDADCGDGYVDVFFTKNGRQVGNVVRMKLPPGGFYPLVGMHSRGEKVRYLGHWKRLPDGKSEPVRARGKAELEADSVTEGPLRMSSLPASFTSTGLQQPEPPYVSKSLSADMTQVSNLLLCFGLIASSAAA